MTSVPRYCVIRKVLNAEGKGVTYMMSTLECGAEKTQTQALGVLETSM